jgi:hypothetical protein
MVPLVDNIHHLPDRRKRRGERLDGRMELISNQRSPFHTH